ncbi:unnamed protein product [Trichobilharzia szidati]|nr:unnamed protein product [Trichobilharzia szidati]
MLHSACITVITEASLVQRDYRWVLGAMAIAVVLYIICISIGATLKIQLKVNSLAVGIGYFVSSIIIAAATLAVYFATQNSTWSVMTLAGGMTILVIPFALFVGQSTLGPREFRQFDPDYCIASMVLHATLVIFLVTLSFGVIVVPMRRPIMLTGLIEPIS